MCDTTVTINYEDREQVERLVEELCEGQWGHRWGDEQVDKMQAALREFADPTPRIEEPTGLGAVVEDADGKTWCLCRNDNRGGWVRTDGKTFWKSFDQINAVRVLSEGVKAGESE